MSATEYSIDRATGLPIIDKADGDTLDYPFNFVELLAPDKDEIDLLANDSVRFTVAGAVLDSQIADKYVATAMISGGLAGATASVQCDIRTKAGRRFERTILIRIVERM